VKEKGGSSVKVLVTGAQGQLGRDLVACSQGMDHVKGYSRQELDITQLHQVREQVQAYQPDVIIHAAAYTNVDQAESEPDRAYAVNAWGTRNVALAAQEVGAKMIYISSDYVFSGQGSEPYVEFDRPAPKSIYGKSKLAGEELTRCLCHKHFIVRTSWVFGKYGHNFVKTMVKLGQKQTEISVVSDQIGSPTYTVDLAIFLMQVAKSECYGTYHVSNQGSCSWYEFAETIFAEYQLNVKVIPITTKDFPRPAPRPAYSVMDHMAIRLHDFQLLRHWRDALHAYRLDCNEAKEESYDS